MAVETVVRTYLKAATALPVTPFARLINGNDILQEYLDSLLHMSVHMCAHNIMYTYIYNYKVMTHGTV